MTDERESHAAWASFGTWVENSGFNNLSPYAIDAMWEIWKHQPAEINLRSLINQINQKLDESERQCTLWKRKFQQETINHLETAVQLEQANQKISELEND